MRVQSIYKNEKTLKDTRTSKVNSVLEGINSQIKMLRSITVRIDEGRMPVAANRVNEMKTNIMLGSVYPLQNSRYAPSFFTQNAHRKEAASKRA